jgi:hypothetical protein
MTTDGLKIGKRTIPWDQLAYVFIRDACITTKERTRRKPRTELLMGKVPNVYPFMLAVRFVLFVLFAKGQLYRKRC